MQIISSQSQAPRRDPSNIGYINDEQEQNDRNIMDMKLDVNKITKNNVAVDVVLVNRNRKLKYTTTLDIYDLCTICSEYLHKIDEVSKIKYVQSLKLNYLKEYQIVIEIQKVFMAILIQLAKSKYRVKFLKNYCNREVIKTQKTSKKNQ